ncbi:MAG: HAD family hydrolase [Planctomycetes bacterium]|nr:HAD family hydrolase [Planctomycetota bacterium]
MLQPAVFLDRDGTLSVERSFITRPDEMQLLPGAAQAVRLLRAAGFACVVVTNQSAIGRGMITEAELDVIHGEMLRQLGEAGAVLDGVYFCPHVDDHPERKPAPGLLLRAAAELQLDLAASWMIGDSLRDILAGQNAGCKGCVLVRSGHPIDETQLTLTPAFLVADDLSAAARHILSRAAAGPP